MLIIYSAPLSIKCCYGYFMDEKTDGGPKVTNLKKTGRAEN